MLKVNLCEYNIMLFRCKESTWGEQKNCEYGKKLPGRNRCLFAYEDGRCGCLTAHNGEEVRSDE